MKPTRTSARAWLAAYLRTESASGLLLALVSVLALVLANSAAAPTYEALRLSSMSFELGGTPVTISAAQVVDDGLMTLFFLVVGLEVRRELHEGELGDARRAMLPLIAAIGGMVAPAAFYAALNPGGAAERGWGIPMATDIAFALAALSLLGSRATPAVRVLLLGLAIIDDIGGVLVIAIFYSGGVEQRWLPLVAIGVVLTLAMRGNGVRSPLAYLVPGLALWVGLHHCGVHPTMAGVVMGLLTPVQRDFGVRPSDRPDLDQRSPSARLQAQLHPWVAFGVMPLFAFLNAGVALDWPVAEPAIATGVLLGLVVGKPLGIVGACWIAVRLRLARLPAGMQWRHVVVVGLVAGVGFTVALFIAGLALPDPRALASAKVGIVVASAIAVVLAALGGRLLLRPREP